MLSQLIWMATVGEVDDLVVILILPQPIIEARDIL